MDTKLDELVSAEGYAALNELVEAVIGDSASPGICMNPGCHYTTEVEPDQRRGYCEVCGTKSVKAGLILAGII